MSKNNIGLVEYCKKQLNSNNTIYCLGTWGQTLTQSVLNQKCNQYSWNNNHKSRISKGLGKKAYDCCGLIKGYLWDEKYNSSTDENESMMLARATVKGKINTLPEVPGTLVFMSGHVGVYIGNKEVIECTPAWDKYAVIKTKLSDRKWTDWAYYKRIEYNTSSGTKSDNTSTQTSSVSISQIQTWYNSTYGSIFGTIAVDNSFGPDTKKHMIKALQYEMNIQYGCKLDRDGSFGPLTKAQFKDLKRGCKGNITRICQAFLYKKGYNPNGFDGSYGPGMQSAVKQYQTDHNLKVDGILGLNTAYSLFN